MRHAETRVGLVLAAFTLSLASRFAHAETARPPNIVLIISDDQTSTDFGFMGNQQVQTPHLDRLAAQSARYVTGYVPSSVCRPSLVTLLTGLYPHQHGVYFNHPPPGFAALTKSGNIDKQQYDELRDRAARQIRDLPTLPRLLSARGYRSLQTGKYWEGHWRNAGFTAGMTTGEPSGGRYGDKRLANGDVVAHGNGDHGLAIGRQTMQPIVEFIDDCGQTPFFIWYAPFLPHTPHDAPREYVDRYRGQPDIPEHRRPYYAAISQFDDTVGNLIAMIEDRGLAGNTLFAFVVDNGWTPDADRFLEATGEWDHTQRSKRAPFEPGLRTPILLRWDDRIPSTTIETPVSSVDMMPTLLSAAGIEVSSRSLPGIDLLPSAQGNARLPQDRPLFGELYPGDASQLHNAAADIAYRWVRYGRFKLIVPHAHHGQPPWNRYLTRPALYDVVADPAEAHDLAGQPAQQQTLAALQSLLDDWWLPQPR